MYCLIRVRDKSVSLHTSLCSQPGQAFDVSIFSLPKVYLVCHVSAGTSMLIEDVACPVDKLGDMTQDLVDMFQKFGYKDASCFGHALEGNPHLVFSQVRPCIHTSRTLTSSAYANLNCVIWQDYLGSVAR